MAVIHQDANRRPTPAAEHEHATREGIRLEFLLAQAGETINPLRERFQVPISVELREQARLSVGDYLEAKVDRMGVISLAPKNFVDRRIAEGLDDIQHGRVRGPFGNVEGLLQSLKGTKPAAKARKR